MNHDQAVELSKRIINTWRLTPPLTEWIDALTDLPYMPALDTFIELRNTHEHAPTIATFRKTYRARIAPTPEPLELEQEEERIGLDEYIGRLTERARTSLAAHNELAIWQRNRHGLGKRL